MQPFRLPLILVSILLAAPCVFGQGHGRVEHFRTEQEAVPEDTVEGLRAIPPLPLPVVDDEELDRLTRSPFVTRPDTGEFFIAGGDAADESAAPGIPERADVNQRPFRSVGRLFFKVPGGGENSCTAAFAGNGTVLLTAAHCVRNGRTGQWYHNFRFYRAYADGGGQRVLTKCVGTWSTWPNPDGPNFAVDYAFIKTKTASGGGWLGMRSGIPFITWTAVGYPSNFEDAKFQHKVVGSKGVVVSNIVQMLGNPMGLGSSGGAWIGDLTTATPTGNYAIGVNSFRQVDLTRMYGPFFDAAVPALFQYVNNGCE